MNAETAAADPAHNSRNSVDYEGTYIGTLPCADCEGIRIEITLTTETFVMRTEYLGVDNPQPFEAGGRFEWDNTGSIITLQGVAPPNRYIVGENILIQLDKNGIRVTGEFADRYILRKQ